MRYFVGAVRLIFIALITLFILAVIFFGFPVMQTTTRLLWIRRLSGVILRILGIRVTVRGRVENPSGLTSDGPGYMVCANHISFADIFVLNSVMPCRFVAKKEIASWPFFGTISKGVDTLFIDRSRKRAVLEIADLMADAMKEGRNVLFFPEGTTSLGTVLLPFFPNLFEAGIRAETKILPITLRYTCQGETSSIPSYAGNTPLFEVLKHIVMTPGLGVEVTVLDPVDAAGRTRHQLCAEVSSLMAASLGVPDATAEKEAARLRRLEAKAD